MFTVARIYIWLALLLAGGYFELSGALLSAYLLVSIAIRAGKKDIRIVISDAFIAACSVSGFYILSIIWAVDRGTAVWGAVKYLPILLLFIVLMQLDAKERDRLFYELPWAGAAMVVITFLLQFIPALKSSLVVNGRLAGFFQYPNTFAAFLVICVLVCILKTEDTGKTYLQFIKKHYIKSVVLSALCCIGIAASGSRLAMAVGALMTAVSIIYLVAGKRFRAYHAAVLIMILAAVASGLLIAGLSGMSSAGHIVRGASGTFWERIIYMQDSLGQIIRHPFGLGYLGYYFSQGSFQSAYYSSRWVHNDLLQLLLDIGWIPFVLTVIALVKTFVSKKTEGFIKIILAGMLLHFMADFDLEFIAMWSVLLMCLNPEEQVVTVKRRVSAKTPVRNNGRSASRGQGAYTGPSYRAHTVMRTAACVIISAACLYVGIASFISYFGDPKTAEKIYPANTFAEVSLLSKTSKPEEMDYFADRIISRNGYVAVAWDAKAEAAYAAGRFSDVITAKRKAIELSPYDENEYTDYENKLSEGIAYYMAHGDTNSATVLKEEMQWMDNYRLEKENCKNPLAKRIE